ncbi:MAG: hypothetical protein R3C14_48505 [Caldilineaceae bacterium]
MNYQQLETLTYERQATFLAEAEQRRLVQHATATQGHPIRAWIGQRLIAFGQRLSSSQATPTLPLITKTVAR